MVKRKEEELVVLKFRRETFVKKIDILHNLSLELSNGVDCNEEFYARFGELKSIYESFNSCHNELMELTVTLNPEADLSIFQELIIELDKKYYTILSTHQKLVSKLNENNSVRPNCDTGSDIFQPQVKLPKIKLPTFNGHIKDWPHFKDLFISLIHENSTISSIEKFQYLLSCLSDEPHNLARTLPITAKNYTTIWEQLVSRYDDKRRLATYYLEEILNFHSLNAESSKKLRNLLDICSENIIALNTTEFTKDLGDFMLFYSIVQKLDKRTRHCFESKHSSSEFPTVNNLLEFLREHCKALDAAQISEKGAQLSQTHSQPYSNDKHFHKPTSNKPYNVSYVSDLSIKKCTYCNETHTIYTCPQFSALPIDKRKEAIKSKQACFNCLSTGHMLNQCFSLSTCKQCGKRHHSLLHYDTPAHSLSTQGTQMNQTSKSTVKPSTNPPLISSLGSGNLCNNSTVLLGTATIQISDSTNSFHSVRALLDPGSQASFITESCVHRLRLPRHKFSEPVSGISQTPVNITKGVVSCLIKPRFKNGPILNANAIVLPKITTSLPTEKLECTVKTYFKSYDLADPFFDVPGEIDVLLGADLYPEIFDGGRQSTPKGMPTLFHSIFGWILIGPTKFTCPKRGFISSNLAISDSHSLDSCIKNFWEIEELPKKSILLSPQDEKCEEFFTQTHARDTNGRYIVRLPFKEDKKLLGNSYDAAEKCFKQLERQFLKNPDLYRQYMEFMNEYEELGHMKKVGIYDPLPKYYIPHHAVFKNDLVNSKIRVVFNASAKTSTGVSLNDQLHVGPKLQNDVCHIISRFRFSPVVFVTDICKMYRQIMVDTNDQSYQAVLWRPTTDSPIATYFLQTVTYGLTSSPFLALRTLHQLGSDESENFPEASKVLIRDSFVDDILVGCDSFESAKRLKEDLINLLQCGGFELKKWSSNCRDLISDVLEQDNEISLCLNSQDLQPIKVLGIKWLPSPDVFTYNVSIENCTPTKRNILSVIARLYDPLGWVAPVVFWAKFLIQQLWLSGVGWDDVPNNNVCSQWMRFVQELPSLQTLNIPRFAIVPNVKHVELHGFCDASQIGYAAVIFLRSEDDNGFVSVNVVSAKSRVAPLKPVTIPRLELCGALLLAKLMKSYKDAVDIKFSCLPNFAWCDSLVALSWIHTPPYQLKTFVANRVNEIQECVDPSVWKYTPTCTNPADCASRGLLPQELLEHPLWWHGPEWLHLNKSEWPEQPTSHISQKDLPEIKSSVFSAVITEPVSFNEFMLRFSSLNRLKRVTAHILRFIHNSRVCRQERKTGCLSINELNDALMFWIKLIQQQQFSCDINKLKKGLPCSKSLQRLDPYLDDQKILRVGGRLRHSDLKFEARHPILLPKKGHFIDLLIDSYHIDYLHVGPRTLQSFIQKRFWILSVRNAIRKRIFKCITCSRFKANSPEPFMSDLPAIRSKPARPFISVGVDFGGPFYIKTDRLRKPQIRKAYLCLFVCMCTKALHLETVSDLSIEAFLAAFQRFICRRGLCTDVYSDRGTTFIGSNNELQHLIYQQEAGNKIQDTLSTKGITWHFNPPYSPNFGGIWEAGIKSTKYHIKRVIGNQIFTFEELSTLFTSIEAILNSRPLCSVSNNPNEIEALTPGHFLIGDTLVNLPIPDLTHLSINRLSRFQLLQQLKQHFWNRWSLEYLHSLQQRMKWTSRTDILKIKEGDLVLIKELNLPAQTWKMGRVESTLPGPDGIVRVVKLKTSKGIVVRPVSKLCPLPVC